MTAADDPFLEMLGELSDGQRWKLLRADGWFDFIERLTALIVDLPLRRRQALVMLMFALTEGLVSPDDAQAWTSEHDLTDEAGIEQMIAWLRQFRPPTG